MSKPMKNLVINQLVARQFVFKSLVLLAIPFSMTAYADNSSTSFSHGDWQVVCDNTQTCRAAGYQSDEGNDLPVSVLLTRKAGARQMITAQVKLGSTDYVENQPKPKTVSLFINGKNYGNVALGSEDLSGNLSTSQSNALTQALGGKSNILFKSGKTVWQLSDVGAAAVLLKMDAVQGRVGTTGAVIKKGKNSEANVLPALPMPVVNWVKPDAKANASVAMQRVVKAVDLKQLQQILMQQQASLLKQDTSHSNMDECPIMDEENDYAKFDLSVQPINAHQLLASGLCWRGAYNEGVGYWVINAQKPYAPKLVTTSGSDYSDGIISSQQKGRGLGDCWGGAEWTWNGQQFIQTSDGTTGMCRLIEMGGAWDLPTRVTVVKKTNIN